MLKNKFLLLNLILACLIVWSIIYYYDKKAHLKSRAIYDKKIVILDISQPKQNLNNIDKSDLDNNERRD